MSHGSRHRILLRRFRSALDFRNGRFRPKLWLWTSEGDVSGSRLRLETLEWWKRYLRKW
ncbi:hypothetical protein RhiirA4_457583 [Rhizophagus irregularis]|uniref:Uncharacterized protein n=1 Tax=Rhizophagus irregularis TaxID=588596 RepID=A0A2I1GAC6_9GLOM|nr:hypothetical protein RhiirA4_457583 [Rhizophagus irregularis]